MTRRAMRRIGSTLCFVLSGMSCILIFIPAFRHAHIPAMFGHDPVLIAALVGAVVGFAGLYLNSVGNHPVTPAAPSGQKQRPVANEERNSALIEAARKGDTKRIKDLIAAGADMNAKIGRSGIPVLTLVAGGGDVQSLQAIISAGADLNAKNSEGETALMHAAWNPINGGDKVGNCVKALIAAGADVNVRNIHGETALQRSAHVGRVDIVSALIAAGADVNTVTNLGNTPLSEATQSGDIDCVKALIAAGADVNYKDQDGTTALKVSRNPEITKALNAAGAKSDTVPEGREMAPGATSAWRKPGEWGVISVKCGKCGKVGDVRGYPESAYEKGLLVQCPQCRHTNRVEASVF